MREKYEGELEIDLENGVIYFHAEDGRTIFRLQGLPLPIPKREFYDVLYSGGVSWEAL